MRRSHVLILFVYVAVCHVGSDNPCGNSPLMLMENFSEIRGVDPESMLVYMRERVPDDYRQLMADYRIYLECTQMVLTGYFKRSVDPNEAVSNTHIQHNYELAEQFRNTFGENMRQLYGSRVDKRISSRNIFKFLLETDTENSAVPFIKLEDLPFIKRLLRSRLSTSHIRRNR